MSSSFGSPRIFTISLTKEHGYAAGVALSSWAVLQYMGIRVMQARQLYKVQYPALYASDSDTQARNFNCVQRGHQNTLENYPQFLLMLGLGSIKYPLLSSIGGGIWLLGRIVYFEGYSTGNPEKRMYGGFAYAGLFLMLGCAAKFTYDLITA